MIAGKLYGPIFCYFDVPYCYCCAFPEYNRLILNAEKPSPTNNGDRALS